MEKVSIKQSERFDLWVYWIVKYYLNKEVLSGKILLPNAWKNSTHLFMRYLCIILQRF